MQENDNNLINDFTIINQGSIVQFLPLTDRAKNWCNKYIPTAMRMGFTYCVEHRYAIDIVEGIKGNHGEWLNDEGNV